MTFVYILLVILAIILVLSFVAPKAYDVSRSIIIEKPVGVVFNYLKFTRNQDDWSPWKKKDPDMHQEFEGTDGTVGFISKWKGNKDVGEGEQELKHLVENESILSELRFFKPWKSQSDGYFRLVDIDGRSTKVVWGFSGRNKFPINIFMLFFNMEKAVSKDFNEGLASLKQKLEHN
ncbi:MAG: SRPBCC family protein [Flavobacteriaceae bacterium]|nr:SRPBCC family protein [Bacteroidia bacterium]MBT8287471.1 SRPBCC family protein [Bacteroidia bacterium]NNF75950.1 SRPBCC family protein [Flavobacteriaceae bacterium]NNK73874.1 SRPBCC family protein [Flavobacteriaceae bacterium]